MISGDQGAGKTTLLRALIAEIPPNERFGTLETDYELLTHLQPGRRNMLALQAKMGLGEQQGDRHVGEWSVADLIPEALRQNLARLVVGEVRGKEALTLVDAWSTGHRGGCSTVHSDSAYDTLFRLEDLVSRVSVSSQQAGIARAIDVIVYIERRAVSRTIAEVLSIDGWDRERHDYMTHRLDAEI